MPALRVVALLDRFPVLTETLDRKSTRLNSSHPSTSYAVFCLKKKNREAEALTRDRFGRAADAIEAIEDPSEVLVRDADPDVGDVHLALALTGVHADHVRLRGR